MTVSRILVLALVALVAASGCSRKAKPVPIESLKLVKDDLRSFEVKVPSNWFQQQRKGDLILAATSRSITSRFLSFGKGEGGAKVELRVIPIDSANPALDTIIERSKLDFELDSVQRSTGMPNPRDMYQLSQVQFGGAMGRKLSIEFDQADGRYKSEMYFAESDSLVTVLTLAAFGNTFGDYEKEFAEIVQSAKLAKRPVVVAKVDTAAPAGPEPPSETLRTYNAPDFSIQIPENFEGKKGQSSGLSSMSFLGSRYDCTIQADVFDASKQNNLDKIIDQNKARYQGASPVATSLNGQKAYYFSYSGGAGVSSRAYFVVKGNKMFRFTLNWYKAEEAIYRPLFERCLGTVTLK
jgi:hypothetical protein